MDETTGFDLGGLLDKSLDTVGKLLTLDAAREQTKLDGRLAETRLQAELYGLPYRPMNAQANAQSYTAAGGFFARNNWAAPVLLIVGAFLVWRAAK